MKTWYKIENKESGNPILRLYGVIGSYEIDAARLVQALEAMNAEDIDVHVHSPGGYIEEAWLILNYMKNSDTKFYFYIDSVAASCASWLTLAGEKVYMYKNGRYFMHRATVGIYGNSEDLRNEADDLDKYDIDIVDMYVQKSGKDKETVMQLMIDESNLTPAEALEYGFIDEILETESGILTDNFKINNFRNIDRKNINKMADMFARQTLNINVNMEENVDKILKLLGAKNEEDAAAIIANLQSENRSMKANIANMQKQNAERHVADLIDNNLLGENQRDWAVNAMINDPDNFAQFESTLETSEEVYTADEAEEVVNRAIADKLIKPAQKNSMIETGKKSKKNLDDFIANASKQNLNDKLDLGGRTKNQGKPKIKYAGRE